MDADQLRLILLALGAALVVAIYAWDRYQNAKRRLRPMPRSNNKQQQGSVQKLNADPEPGDLPRMVADTVDEVGPLQLTESDTVLREEDSALQAEMDFGSIDDMDYLHQNEGDEDMPKMVVQIALVRPNKPIGGHELAKALAEVGLSPGEMNIYHRYDEHRKSQAWFSIANLVEPGNFPMDDMSDFRTPGILIFTQLPGVRDGMMIYSEMMFVAERLAGILSAVLQDENHSALSKQAVEHTKDLILEHRRKLQLARRK